MMVYLVYEPRERGCSAANEYFYLDEDETDYNVRALFHMALQIARVNFEAHKASLGRVRVATGFGATASELDNATVSDTILWAHTDDHDLLADATLNRALAFVREVEADTPYQPGVIDLNTRLDSYIAARPA